MRRILLVEPAYRNKYPPLGLMKISAYHKRRGDYVRFVKGCDATVQRETWDRIYVSTIFTFYWDISVKTIQFYTPAVPEAADVWVGGVLATLMSEELRRLTGATVVEGLIDRASLLDADSRQIVDELTPDYGMLDSAGYSYGLQDAYLGYATRGCPNRCDFCAVSRIEPKFVDYLPLKRQVRALEALYGERHNLVLMDNSVLASNRFEQIIDDLLELGFHRGAKLNKRLRRVDFNQGTDVRLLTDDKMRLLAKTAIRPLRLAFDDGRLRDAYVRGVRLATEHGVRHLSNYVLYNYRDTPEDFYERLRTNIVLNEELETLIYSFPMKFMPLDAKDRSYVGPHWNRKLLRGIQCVLVATRGMVGPHRDFFEAAFGRDASEFVEIVMMPEEYIVQRHAHAGNGASEWQQDFRGLTGTERVEFFEVLALGAVTERTVQSASTGRLKRLFGHYLGSQDNFEPVDQLKLELD